MFELGKLGVGLVMGLLASALAAQTGAPPADALSGDDPTIVVTARPLAELKRDYETCLATSCAAREDMMTSLAYVEGLFVAGDYNEASAVVRRSIRRNQDAAAVEPDLYSMLYRASSRLSAALGGGDRYWIDTHQILRTHRNAQDPDQSEILLSELEVSDMSLKMGQTMLASRLVKKVLREARELGLQSIEQTALLRYALLPARATNDRAESLRRLAKLTEITGDEDEASRRTRIIAGRLIAQLRARPGQQPDLTSLQTPDETMPRSQMLLWTPPAEDEIMRQNLGTAMTFQGGVIGAPPVAVISNVKDRWADISFRVMPDGRVSEVVVLRKHGSGDWAEVCAKQVAGRIYTPLPPSLAVAQPDGEERVERHTWTAFTQPRRGSLISTQTENVRVEIVDMTLRDTPVL